MNLRDKLKIYTNNPNEAPLQAGYQNVQNPLAEIGGEKIDYKGHSIWKFTSHLPADELKIEGNQRDSDDDISRFLKHNMVDTSIPLDNLIFFDLETTSLSTGTGNYPFLIGVGYLKDDIFVIEQFFLDSFASEEAILRYILRYFNSAEAIVSFNGKSFDIPLIKNRYRINRVPGFPVEKTNIDLLYSCRRIFRTLYESCSLKTIEERVLGLKREGDIPGWLIPDVFFSYQRDGEIGRIPDVLEHNVWDIRSMFQLVIFLNKIYRSIDERDYRSINRRSLVNIANYLYRIDISSFLDLMDYIGSDIFFESSLFKKYSTVLKRLGKSGDALQLWEDESSIFSLEELAKYHEHREKDCGRALFYCNSAMKLLARGSFSLRSEQMDEETADKYRIRFDKRMQRLNRKLVKLHG